MKRIFIIALGATTLSGIASADLFEATAIINKRETATISHNGSWFNVYSGPVAARINGGTAFDAYCVDLDHWGALPAHYEVAPTPISTINYGGRAAYLYNTYAALVDTKSKGAALQLAIWDVITDNGDGFNAGGFKAKNVSNDTLALAQSYLAASQGKNGAATVFKALDHGANCDKNQDFMGPVPEPASMAVLGVGVAAMLRRRRKNA